MGQLFWGIIDSDWLTLSLIVLNVNSAGAYGTSQENIITDELTTEI
jgi:hypothetical protein